MEPSHSETYSDEVPETPVEETYGKYSDQYVDQLFENLKWSTAVLAVMLQNEGGTVVIEKDVLEGIDLNRTLLNVKVEDDHYVVEGVFHE